MPTILIVDDDATVLHIFRRAFEQTDIKVLTATTSAEGIEVVRESHPDVVVLDIILPDQSGLAAFEQVHACDPAIPIVFITATGTSNTAIEAIKLGALDYLLKPLDLAKVRQVIEQAIRIRRLMHIPVKFSESGDADFAEADTFVGRCSAMQDVYKAIGRVAPQTVSVLILGESGTGKELVARAVYQHSERSNKLFLAVNCAAIPEPLLESELFGHEKGTFTGAVARRIGKFEQCDGGTLFLDEVGDMTPLTQSKVLRVLQEKRFERIGGSETIETDLRVIAATNRDLEAMVAEGKFRADLYYRLNGFSITLPPLRDRGPDVPVLVDYFARRFSRELGKSIRDVSPEAMDCLVRYRWPGNVRELQSVVKQAMLQTVGSVLLPEFLPVEVRGVPETADTVAEEQALRDAITRLVDKRLQSGTVSLYADSVGTMERMVLSRVLEHVNGNESKAAQILGIGWDALRERLRANKVGAKSPDEPGQLGPRKE